MTIRLAIIDGHTLTRGGLRQLVAQQADIEIVRECSSAVEAHAVVMQSRPAVVTIDTMLPDGDGIRLARELRDRDADLGIVVLSSDGGDELLLRAMEIGASAFVKKTAPVAEVLAAIRHAAVAASSFTASGLPDAVARRRLAREQFGLSPREMEVLRLLRDGMSIPAIAATMFIAQSTAKTYVSRLYDKLGAVNRAQALMTAAHYGLIRYEQDAIVRLPATGPRGGETGRRGPAAVPAEPALGRLGHDGGADHPAAPYRRPSGKGSSRRRTHVVAGSYLARPRGECDVLQVSVP